MRYMLAPTGDPDVLDIVCVEALSQGLDVSRIGSVAASGDNEWAAYTAQRIKRLDTFTAIGSAVDHVCAYHEENQ